MNTSEAWWPVLAGLIGAVGSISLFMAGFTQVGVALMHRVGPWFRRRVTRERSGAVDGFAAGVSAAALTGSSTAAVISLITLVDGASVRAERTPWILLGINLGAAVSCWIVALTAFHVSVALPALVLLAIALPLRLSVRLQRYSRGELLTAVALLMLGLDLLSGTTRVVPDAARLLTTYHGIVAGAVGGLAVSAVLRSSVGTAVLAMSLAVRGWIGYETAAAVVVAGNAGLTLTGLIASRALGAEARRTAFYHLVLNVAGTTVGLSLLLPLTQGVLVVVPGGGATALAVRLAALHTLIHLGNPLLLLLFRRIVVALGARFVPSREPAVPSERPYALSLVPQTVPESLDANLMRTRAGLAVMAGRCCEMLMIVINTTQVPDDLAAAVDRTVAIRGTVKDLEEQITGPLVRSIQLSCTRVQAETIQRQERIAQQLSLITDACFKAMRLLERSYQKRYRFHEESRTELFEFTAQILDFLTYIRDYLEDRIDQPELDLANRMESAIDAARDKLKKRARRVLEKSGDADIKAELAFVDIVAHLEHVGDRCLTIAETVQRLSGPRA